MTIPLCELVLCSICWGGREHSSVGRRAQVGKLHFPADIFDPEDDPAPNISSMNVEELRTALAQVLIGQRPRLHARKACVRLGSGCQSAAAHAPAHTNILWVYAQARAANAQLKAEMKQEHERRMNAVKVMLRLCPALCASTPAVAGCSRCACTDLQALLQLVTNLRSSGCGVGWDVQSYVARR